MPIAMSTLKANELDLGSPHYMHRHTFYACVTVSHSAPISAYCCTISIITPYPAHSVVPTMPRHTCTYKCRLVSHMCLGSDMAPSRTDCTLHTHTVSNSKHNDCHAILFTINNKLINKFRD